MKITTYQRIRRAIRLRGFLGMSSELFVRAGGSLYLYFCRKFGVKIVRARFGPKLLANYGDITFRFYVLGTYDKFLSKQIKAIHEPFCFIDVGANQGLYSIIAAKVSACMAVFSYEPVLDTFEKLIANIDLNQVSDKAHAIRMAIDSHSTSRFIHIPLRHSGAASLSTVSVRCGGEMVDTAAADVVDTHILKSEFYNIAFFIKIDAEGHDEVVIKELMKCWFWPNVKWLFFEKKDLNEDESFLNVLIEEGFSEKFRSNFDLQSGDIFLTRS